MTAKSDTISMLLVSNFHSLPNFRTNSWNNLNFVYYAQVYQF